MMIAPALKRTAREIAMKLTIEDILKMVYIIDAWLDIQEEIKRTAEKFNRIMGTRQMFRSPQEAIMYEMLQRELMGTPRREEEEEEEEVDEEIAARARMKLEELIDKIKQKAEEKEIARAKTALERAKAYGLIEPEEEQELRSYIEKKEKQLKGYTETEKEEKG